MKSPPPARCSFLMGPRRLGVVFFGFPIFDSTGVPRCHAPAFCHDESYLGGVKTWEPRCEKHHQK